MSQPEIIVPAEKRAVDIVRVTLGGAGLVAAVIGAVILFNPAGTGIALMSIISATFAVLAILGGIVYVAVAVFSRTSSTRSRIARGLIGAVWIAAGVVIFIYLTFFATLLAAAFSVIVGIGWIVEGIVALLHSRESRSMLFSIVYGALSITAGAVLVFSPFLGAATLWIFLGASMLVIGVLQVIRAFTVKHDADVLVV